MITPPRPLPLLSVLTVGVSVPSGVAEVAVTLMLCASVRSTSVKAIVPLSVRLPVAATSSVTAPVTSAAATSGASSVPVMVITTVLSAVLTGLLLSLARTV